MAYLFAKRKKYVNEIETPLKRFKFFVLFVLFHMCS